MKPYSLLLLIILVTGSTSSVSAQETLIELNNTPSADQSIALNPLSTVSPSEMASFLNRPLFSPSRRQPSAPQHIAEISTPPASVPAADHLHLVGTLTTAAASSAVIQNTRSQTTVSASNGQIVDGWRIVEIGTSTVRLEQQGIRVTLEMFRVRDALIIGNPTPSNEEASSLPTDASLLARQLPVQSRSTASATVQGNMRATAFSAAAPPGTIKGTAAASTAAQSDYKLIFGAPPSVGAKQ